MARLYLVSEAKRAARPIRRLLSFQSKRTSPYQSSRSVLSMPGLLLLTVTAVAGGATLALASNDMDAPSNDGTEIKSSNASQASVSASTNGQSSPQGHSTQITSTNDEGQTSTEVIIDGQKVDVPDNGTVTHSSSNGHTTITTTNSGSSSNTVINQNSVSVDGGVSSYSFQEVTNTQQ